MKVCTNCGIKKDDSKFSKSIVTKDGLCYKCKDCNKEYKALYYLAKKELLKTKANTWKEYNPDKRKSIANKFAKNDRINNPDKYRQRNKEIVDKVKNCYLTKIFKQSDCGKDVLNQYPVLIELKRLQIINKREIKKQSV